MSSIYKHNFQLDDIDRTYLYTWLDSFSSLHYEEWRNRVEREYCLADGSYQTAMIQLGALEIGKRMFVEETGQKRGQLIMGKGLASTAECSPESELASGLIDTNYY